MASTKLGTAQPKLIYHSSQYRPIFSKAININQHSIAYTPLIMGEVGIQCPGYGGLVWQSDN